ncbi:MAG: ABC transporter permease [Clostridium sp.]|jgi:NitT/TauT family transport system permease protein|uniref:ABC transporter permease n=1 Tax=Clostridium sp. TaxID=1506 RepID=UPI0025B7E61A|nr:ABC transporter permease [Clostridium sp.]MCH3964854.1 ABC transporter permease [Clostridium sp.]MCI1716651.1 ABC transporter permease [Clostridium sp.]MCI1800867.1 ABC transporter permease [Clostridium sp.]MCI1814828.1 ABC transporter permease [Clostridium sp.]MCI1871614.1 ABC transporter permease [Clostridium sp.]
MRKMFRIRKNIDKKLYMLVAGISFVLLILVWNFASISGIVNPVFLPTPQKVVKTIIESITSGNIWGDLYISCYRIFMGFLYAVIVGVVIGILVGCFSGIEAFVQPLTEFIRYLPVPAFVPLIMVWFGIGEQAKIAVIFLGTLFQLIPMVSDDVKAVPEDFINAAYTLGASRGEVLWKVIIPAMLPKLMDTLRMMMGWAWTYLVVAELVAASSGLGYSILKAQRYLKTDVMFANILIIGLLGLVIDRTFGFVSKHVFAWAEGGNQ